MLEPLLDAVKDVTNDYIQLSLLLKMILSECNIHCLGDVQPLVKGCRSCPVEFLRFAIQEEGLFILSNICTVLQQLTP